MKAGFKYLLVFCMASVAGACSFEHIHEKMVFFNKQEWPQNNKPWIKMMVEDSLQQYDVIVVVRHTTAFKYNNLIVNFSTIAPGDTAQTQRINLPLGREQGWIGDTLGSVIETRIRINQHPVRLKYGENTFVFQQLMPDDPLRNILNIGVRIEKHYH